MLRGKSGYYIIIKFSGKKKKISKKKSQSCRRFLRNIRVYNCDRVGG
jgi:hypothetical protein